LKSVVVGGAGFLGSAVAADLVAREHDVVLYDVCGSQATCDMRLGLGAARFVQGDILDRDRLRGVIDGADEVFHFAGMLGTAELDDEATTAAEVNILGSVRLFEAAIACGVTRVFHASKPNVWLNAYSITKHAAEQFAELLGGAQDRTAFSSLCYFNAFGPHQAHGPVRKLIPSLVRQALNGEPLEVFGSGDQVVDLIYVEDLAKLTTAYVRVARDARPLDCGRGVPVSVNQVAQTIDRIVGNHCGIRHLPMRRGEVEGTVLVADPGPLLAEVGAFAFAPLEDALCDTVDWYRRQWGGGSHGRKLAHALA
jgi:UDP-glucose 4-epimerase